MKSYEANDGWTRLKLDRPPTRKRLSWPRWVIGLLLLGVALAISLCASVLGVGLWLSAPSRVAIGSAPDDLPGAEAVQMPSTSGSLLRGWWVPAIQPGGGAVILMHGVHANRLTLVRRAQVLHGHGFAVLLFDFQAHGESPGTRITFGRLESLDAVAALGFVHDRLPHERVGAIGISLGGAAALLGPEPLRVDALVLESVYPDIDTALSDRLRAALGPVAGTLFPPLLVPAFDLLLPPLIGVRSGQLRPIDQIGRVTAPLLIASGTADTHTLLSEAQALYQLAPEPKRFWAVQGAAHVDLERHDPEAYWREVLPFLVAQLRPVGTNVPH